MDQGTIKTPIPKCRLYWCVFWGGVAISESAQKHSVKLLQNMVYNTTLHPLPPPPPTAKHCLYILYVYFGKGGGVRKVREKVEGYSLQEWSKIPTRLTVSPVYKLY
jgi:hypothetical protein